MNTRNKSSIKNISWRNMVIFITLIFMIINALPNLYPDKTNIQLISNNSNIEQTTPEQLNTLLLNNNLASVKIITNATGTIITLENKSDEQAAKELLNTAFAGKYVISSTVSNEGPSWFKAMNMEPIKLGLDLSGGGFFVLDVDTERAFFEHMKGLGTDLKTQSIEKRIRGVNVAQVNNYSLEVSFPSAMKSKLELLLSDITKHSPELSTKNISNTHISLLYSPQEQVNFR